MRFAREAGNTDWHDMGDCTIEQAAALFAERLRNERGAHSVFSVEVSDRDAPDVVYGPFLCERVERWEVHDLRPMDA